MGGRTLSDAEAAEFDALAVRAVALGLVENPSSDRELGYNSEWEVH